VVEDSGFPTYFPLFKPKMKVLILGLDPIFLLGWEEPIVGSLHSKSRILRAKRERDIHSGRWWFCTHFPLLNPTAAVLNPIFRIADRTGIGHKNVLYHSIPFVAPTYKNCRRYLSQIFIRTLSKKGKGGGSYLYIWYQPSSFKWGYKLQCQRGICNKKGK
jgi:hypothetical protein